MVARAEDVIFRDRDELIVREEATVDHQAEKLVSSDLAGSNAKKTIIFLPFEIQCHLRSWPLLCYVTHLPCGTLSISERTFPRREMRKFMPVLYSYRAKYPVVGGFNRVKSVYRLPLLEEG